MCEDQMEKTLSQLYFGELEAFDEAKQNREFFRNSFVVPTSMSLETLRNDRKFIIVGRKGSGKTAVQMNLADKVREKGFLTHHFRFFYDLRGDDYAEASRTQSEVSFASIVNEKNLFLHYDFRDIWERTLLRKLGERIISGGFQNKFTAFCVPPNSKFRNIFDGILKGLKIKVEGEMLGVAAGLSLDLEDLGSDKSMTLNLFNKIARELLLLHCSPYQVYFFVDELVFSRLDGSDDEIKLKAALVRDLIRTCWELNSFCAQNNLEVHFICSLRPEVRGLINDLDAEAGKYLDGKDVSLSWTSNSGGRLLVQELIEKKVRFSTLMQSETNLIDPETFLAKSIKFGNRTSQFQDFLLTNTWCRPRDIVRLLIEVSKSNPSAIKMGETEIKAALDGYSRASAKELIDELGVRFGQPILAALRSSVSKREFQNVDEFWNALSRELGQSGKNQIVNTLFELGFIGGKSIKPNRYFWAHRGETYLKPHHRIVIHRALWNEFSIRSKP